MRRMTADEASRLEQKQKEKMESSGSSKIGELLKKYNYDVYAAGNRVAVPKGAKVSEPGIPGSTGKNTAPFVIVLNNTLDDINYMGEHSFYYPNNDKNKYRFEPCLDYGADDPKCPICKAARQKFKGAKYPYVRMALTVLIPQYEDNGQIKTYHKKLLVVKGDENRQNFNRVLQTGAAANNGSIRGLTFTLERSNEEKSASSGKPYIPVDGSLSYSFTPETSTDPNVLSIAAIQQFVQPTEVKDKEGKYVTKPVNWLTTAIDINSNPEILQYSEDAELWAEFDPSHVHDLNANTGVNIPQSTGLPAPGQAAPAAVSTAPAPASAPVPSPAATVPAPVSIPPVAAPVTSAPAPTAALIPAAPSGVDQRHLQPVAASVQNGQVPAASAESHPWDQE